MSNITAREIGDVQRRCYALIYSTRISAENVDSPYLSLTRQWYQQVSRRHERLPEHEIEELGRRLGAEKE